MASLKALNSSLANKILRPFMTFLNADNISTQSNGSRTNAAGDSQDEKWDIFAKVLINLVRNPEAATKLLQITEDEPPPGSMSNWTVDLTSLVRRQNDPGRIVLLLMAYSVIIVVSFFGNLLVCHVVLRTRRLHTVTNTFLANLALSDLMMTSLNIPFNVARVLLDNWPFGSVMCSLVPFAQVASVYVSTFTMVAVALDRYKVIIHPLKPRLTPHQGLWIIAVIWVLSLCLALPYAVFNKVVDVFTYRKMTRCQALFPSPALEFRRWLTLATFLTQYVIPLTVTLAAYVCITHRVWWRTVVGSATQQQISHQVHTKWKTIKMLLIVVIAFALCWLPLNTYHLVADFSTSVGPSRHSSTLFFLCHWFAMSNVCYNPFIYCWLNDHFRAGAESLLYFILRKVCRMQVTFNTQLYPDRTRSSRYGDSLTPSSSTTSGIGSIRRKAGSDSLRTSSHGQRSSSSSSSVEVHIPLNDLLPPQKGNETGRKANNDFVLSRFTLKKRRQGISAQNLSDSSSAMKSTPSLPEYYIYHEVDKIPSTFGQPLRPASRSRNDVKNFRTLRTVKQCAYGSLNDISRCDVCFDARYERKFKKGSSVRHNRLPESKPSPADNHVVASEGNNRKISLEETVDTQNALETVKKLITIPEEVNSPLSNPITLKNNFAGRHSTPRKTYSERTQDQLVTSYEEDKLFYITGKNGKLTTEATVVRPKADFSSCSYFVGSNYSLNEEAEILCLQTSLSCPFLNALSPPSTNSQGSEFRTVQKTLSDSVLICVSTRGRCRDRGEERQATTRSNPVLDIR